MDVAVIVGIEKYPKKVKPMKWAEKDATEFEAALKLHDVKTTLLLGSAATKTSIEANVRKVSKSLTKDDRFIFFFSGHGFSKRGNNYLMTCDFMHDDPVRTSVSLQSLMNLVSKAGCSAAFFVDACESGVNFPQSKGLEDRFSVDDLKKVYASSSHFAIFASCKQDESSFWSDDTQHGFWAYYVIEAFRGRANPNAYTKNVLLTSQSLQDWLSVVVPPAVQMEVGEQQTPWFTGAKSGTFLLADISNILAKKTAAKTTGLRGIFVCREETVDIAEFDDYDRKKHFRPKRASDDGLEFMRRLAASRVNGEAAELRETLAKSGSLKLKDIQIEDSSEGAFVQAPDFVYSITVWQDKEEPDSAIIRRELTTPNTIPAVSLEDVVDQVFDEQFDLVEFFPSPISSKNAIKLLETTGTDEICKLNYPSDKTSCTLTVPNGKITIRESKLTFGSILLTYEADQYLTPNKLLEQCRNDLEFANSKLGFNLPLP